MLRNFFRLPILMLLCGGLLGIFPRLNAQRPVKVAVTGSVVAGKQIFVTTCAACHGLDGGGGERGPDISHRQEIQRLPEKALLKIVRGGVPGTGMPAFSAFSPAEVQSVVLYLRNLQGQGPVKLPGDPKQGKTIFFGKAGCSQCHMANGEGGFIASDLSSYANTQSMEEIRSAITDPNKNLDPRKRTVIVTTEGGQLVTGAVRNEDNFSLQVQTADGTLHLLAKSEMRSIEYQTTSLMPGDYGSRLSRQELDDLVSYLASIARNKIKPQSEQE